MTRNDLMTAVMDGRVIATHGYNLDGGFTAPTIPALGGVYGTRDEADDAIATSPVMDGVMMSSTTWITRATPEMVEEMPDWMVALID